MPSLLRKPEGEMLQGEMTPRRFVLEDSEFGLSSGVCRTS